MTMKYFATSCLTEIFGEEMKSVGKILHSSGRDVTEKDFTDVDFDKIIDDVKKEAPTIWLTLRLVLYTPKQEKRNTKKDLCTQYSNSAKYFPPPEELFLCFC